MNPNAETWVVSAWKFAHERNTSGHWDRLENHLLVLAQCAETRARDEWEDYFFLAAMARTRQDMCPDGQTPSDKPGVDMEAPAQNRDAITTVTIEVPDWATRWFQTFVERSHFDTFTDLAENFDEEEAYLLRNAVYAVNDAIIKARGQ
jgi:hypothetical protein